MPNEAEAPPGPVVLDWFAEAHAEGKPVSIYVERNNPALSLYDRLGFRSTGGTEVYLRMEAPPPA